MPLMNFVSRSAVQCNISNDEGRVIIILGLCSVNAVVIVLSVQCTVNNKVFTVCTVLCSVYSDLLFWYQEIVCRISPGSFLSLINCPLDWVDQSI